MRVWKREKEGGREHAMFCHNKGWRVTKAPVNAQWLPSGKNVKSSESERETEGKGQSEGQQVQRGKQTVKNGCEGGAGVPLWLRLRVAGGWHVGSADSEKKSVENNQQSFRIWNSISATALLYPTAHETILHLGNLLSPSQINVSI